MSERSSDDVVRSVTAAFESAYGSAPTGVWSAPGRVNLIGEHTDYNGGLCLPIALPHRTFAAVSRRDDDLLRVSSAQQDGVVEVALDDISADTPGGWASYVAGVLWALRRDGLAVGGLDVLVDSTVPLGAGLSSSAALECSVAAAASDLFGLGLLESTEGRARLAARCVEAENDIAGAPTGGMDQSAALLCGEAAALLLDCRSGDTRQVPFDLDGAGCVLLVTDTRAEHALVDGQYAARRDACEQAARALGVDTLREIDPSGLDDALARLDDDEVRRRVRHVVTEIERVTQTVEALGSGDLDEVGRLFDASHASLRDDYEVSCEELDVATGTARRHGALGARMTGGGFGGSCIAIVRADDADAVAAAIAEAFAEQGFTAPASFTVTASAPAARDR
ncbi:galactokinase [Terrabacter aeriphilus]|uniref:Galactokinase n=1 Tax=Terrabacter aeriphilus TaxID=515662 RepID=A0ABP9J655_9MICO